MLNRSFLKRFAPAALSFTLSVAIAHWSFAISPRRMPVPRTGSLTTQLTAPKEHTEIKAPVKRLLKTGPRVDDLSSAILDPIPPPTKSFNLLALGELLPTSLTTVRSSSRAPPVVR